MDVVRKTIALVSYLFKMTSVVLLLIQ